MKKHILLGTALASLFALGACDYNEDNFPGFDEKETITDVSTDTLVLADAHYGKIASMPKNQGIALAKDPEGQTYLTALNQLGKTKMFTDMVAPEDYLPAFVDSLYAYLSDGSKVLVQYNIGKEQPEYLSKINEAQTFDLTSDNYATVWGESMVVKYLTPSTLKKLPALLKEGIKNPKTGDVCQVNYAWSETEPSTGGGAVKMVYQKVTSIDAEGGNYVIVAPTKDNTWIPFGQFKDPDKTYGYMEGEPVEIADGFITSDVSNHIMTLTPTEKGFTMQRPDGKFIYQSGTFNSFNISTSIPEGGDWSFAYNYDRKAFDVKNVEKDKIIKLNFYEKGNSYSYGSYPNATLGIYMNESFNGNEGGFTTQNVKLTGTLTNVWKVDGKYGWKGSAHVGDSDFESEAWVVSPIIDLAKAKAPLLKVDIAINFLNGNNRADFIELLASEDYVDDVASQAFQWKALNVPQWPEGKNWNYVNSGDIDLSAYEGKKIAIAFRYKSTTECAPTVEFKNMSLTSTVSGYYEGVDIYKEIPESEAEMPARAVTRASDVKPNASALYQYDGSAWIAYEESASIGIRVMQPADYVSTGSDYLSDADAVLPVYLKNAFPYAQSGDVKAVVYFGNKEYDVMADEYGFDGTAWVKKNTETETAEMAFLKTDGKWMEAKEYYSNDFAGELHNDAQIVNVKLDGMNYVWSAGAGYTRIKASGYYQRNRDTEAWLVTGEVDLTEAIAPQMVFTASADYLYGGKIENAVSVHVSENYIPAASTATEEEKIAALQGAAWSDPLSFEWPTSSKEIEMRTSMADYVGKKVYVAFRYASNTDPGFAPTFYMSNFVVKE